MERERTRLRAELDLVRLRDSVDWLFRERQPDERCRLRVDFRLGFDSATTVLLEEAVSLLRPTL